MSQSDWGNILVDTAAVPKPLSEERFAAWVSAQRIFISSAMDGELNPFRDAMRLYLEGFSPQTPMMWETISPQDIRPKTAFLNGVDQSSLFILILGTSYGAADGTGFSPTHQEANHAVERHLARLLFTLPASSSARDGKLNRWLRELYVEISGSSVETPEDLIRSADARLRDFAARSERQWLKLGNCLFPGKVTSQSDRHGRRTFVVTAQAYDHRVRQALIGINDPRSRQSSEIRLTWPNESYPVEIESVEQAQQFAGEADVIIRCRTPNGWNGNTGGGISFGSVNGIGQEELCRLWVCKALFGELEGQDATSMGFDLVGMYSRPDGPTLPQVLTSSGAVGWQAEGVSQLYAIEEAARSRGARFSVLRAGPATANGIRLKGQMSIDQVGSTNQINVDGVVPISR